MTNAPPPDEIVRGILDGGVARFVAVFTTGVAREAIRRHEAASAAGVALARGLTSGLLLATLTKDKEQVTLQILSDGPLGGIIVDATAAGTARAYVKNPAVGLPPTASGLRASLRRALGTDGIVNVTRDIGVRQGLRGQTALQSGEIDEDVEHYLNTSEQIDSALACDEVLADDGTLVAAAGILVQALPGSQGAATVVAARELLREGALLRALGSRPEDGVALLHTALGDHLGDPKVLDARPVRFHCPCSRDRAGASLALLGAAELADMILEDGKAEIICNFCRARHDFSAADLELIRRELNRPAGPPS
jgi:molecular chaperone Hsp33